jgi:hypothetical protein
LRQVSGDRGGEAVIDDAIDAADAMSAVVTVADRCWLAALCGLIVYLFVMTPRLKIEKNGPTDDSPRVLYDEEIEDLENRGAIW